MFNADEIRDALGRWARGGSSSSERTKNIGDAIKRDHHVEFQKINEMKPGQRRSINGHRVRYPEGGGVSVTIGGRTEHYQYPVDAAHSVGKGKHIGPALQVGHHEDAFRRLAGIKKG